MARKIILNLAMSLDGFICREDGAFNWIKGDGDKSHDTKNQFDLFSFLEQVDVVVMGRKAYEDIPEESKEMYKSKKVYVASSIELEKTLEDVEFISGDIVSKIVSLKKEEGKNIWLYGGAGLTDSFIKEKVIDEYIIGIIPTILGKGRPLFFNDNPEIELHLLECTVQEGTTLLRYENRLN